MHILDGTHGFAKHIKNINSISITKTDFNANYIPILNYALKNNVPIEFISNSEYLNQLDVYDPEKMISSFFGVKKMLTPNSPLSDVYHQLKTFKNFFPSWTKKKF